MKVVITGGHITPALGLLPLLKKKHELLFLIRKNTYEGDRGESFEYKTIQTLGLPYRIIHAGRLNRRFTPYTLISLLKIPLGFLQAFHILIQARPTVVLSFGGYIALPVCLAAALLGIPIVTHEQTVKAGLANRIIAFFAKKVCISLKESATLFPKEKIVFTGNPLRKELLTAPKEPPSFLREVSNPPAGGEKLPILYITGGGGGAHTLNQHVLTILPALLQKHIVVHQVGASQMFSDYDDACRKKDTLPPDLQKRYIPKTHLTSEELAWLYRHIAFLIGRSGANTVYEILTFGLPSLLIPLNDEQTANAKLVEEAGIGETLFDDTLTAEELLAAVQNFTKKRKKTKVPMQSDADIKLVEVLEQQVTR